MEKNFEKCKSFDVAYLQLRAELHWSLAFLSMFIFTLPFLNNFYEIVHFQKGGLVPLIPPLAAPV